MIWVIANRIEEDGSFPTYRHYKKAFEDKEINIYCAGQNDDFSFLKKEDVVLMRTRDENIMNAVRKAQMEVGFRSTAESPQTNFLTWDKDEIKGYFAQYGILCPKTVSLEKIRDGKKYFVKPKCGENSIGIDEHSLCNSRAKVVSKFNSLLKLGIEPIIEEYVEGFDVTASVIYDRGNGCLRVDAIKDIVGEGAEFQTKDDKEKFIFDPSKPCEVTAYDDAELVRIAKLVFKIVKAKHYIRVDFRIKEGIPYVIDVNMIPGLAPNGYTSRCLEAHGVGYYDMIRMVVDSAL